MKQSGPEIWAAWSEWTKGLEGVYASQPGFPSKPSASLPPPPALVVLHAEPKLKIGKTEVYIGEKTPRGNEGLASIDSLIPSYMNPSFQSDYSNQVKESRAIWRLESQKRKYLQAKAAPAEPGSLLNKKERKIAERQAKKVKPGPPMPTYPPMFYRIAIGVGLGLQLPIMASSKDHRNSTKDAKIEWVSRDAVPSFNFKEISMLDMMGDEVARDCRRISLGEI